MVTTATKPQTQEWIVGFEHPREHLAQAEQIREMLICAESPVYFMIHYAHIYDALLGEWVPFELWPAQIKAVLEIVRYLLVVILKARQLGVTWIAVAFVLWLMLFRPAATALFFSRRDDEAIELVSERLRGMYLRLPSWMQARAVVTDSKHEFALSNGSRALAFPTTGGDSYTATIVVADEFDLIQDQEKLMRSVKPTIDNGGRLILLSRPDKSKPTSYFKEAFRGAHNRTGENGFHAIFLPWMAHPRRDQAWYKAVKRDIMSTSSSVDGLYEQYPATEEEALAQAFSDLVYPNFSLEYNVSLEAEYDPRNSEIFWEVDDGYAFGDGPFHANYHPRIVHVGQYTPLGGMHVFYEYEKCGVADYAETIAEVQADLKKLGCPPIPRYCRIDSSAAMFRGALHAAGISTTPSTHKVSEGIKNVRRLICDGNGVRLLKIHPRCNGGNNPPREGLIKSLATYSYDGGSAVAQVGEPKPLKVGDHHPDGLRYGAEQLRPRRKE